MEQEKWSSEILNSLNGMEKAEPSPYLFSKIQTRLHYSKEEKVPLKWAFLSMASLCIIFFLNITVAKAISNDDARSTDNEIIYEQQKLNSDQLY